MMQRSNGHTSAPENEVVLEFDPAISEFVRWEPASLPALPPLAEVGAAEAVVYVLGAVALLVLAAMIWTHEAGKGARK